MDTVSGFLSQNFVGTMLVFILIPFFLIVLYVMALYVRASRRVKKLSAEARSASAPSGLDLLNQARTEYSEADMPDVALLAAKPVSADQRVTLHDGEKVSAQPVLSVLRDDAGRLLVQMDGVGYRTLADNPDVKRQFTRVMKELTGVVTGGAQPSAPEPAPKPPTAADLMASAQPLAAAPRPTTTVPKAAGPLPGDLPSYRFDDNPAIIKPGAAGFHKVDFTPPPAVDIASAIEAYLQWRLSATDEFRGRELHVVNAPGGGVRIRVDNEYYDFVDDIRDPAAKAFIKQSIQEWQERQG